MLLEQKQWISFHLSIAYDVLRAIGNLRYFDVRAKRRYILWTLGDLALSIQTSRLPYRWCHIGSKVVVNLHPHMYIVQIYIFTVSRVEPPIWIDD